MPSTPRTSRPGAGPGRGRPRHRSVARTTNQPVVGAGPEETAAERRERRPHGIGITRRAVILLAVVAFLLVSYANSLRIYLDTERQNAENLQAIQRSQAHIDDLNAQLARWDDPDFVRAQARERLGWVMPGETGYRVIGADGKPVGAEAAPGPAATPEPRTWWERTWGSVKTADRPVPIPPPSAAPSATPSERAPITDGTRTPSPRRTPTPSKKAR